MYIYVCNERSILNLKLFSQREIKLLINIFESHLAFCHGFDKFPAGASERTRFQLAICEKSKIF